MTDFLNTISGDGAAWTGDAPAANDIIAGGAVWTLGGVSGDASASGVIPFGGGGTATVVPAALAAMASGVMTLGGSATALGGGLAPSSRRLADPATSANGGRIVRPD